MRLRHIEVFHAIKRTGSISRGAALLAISQPAASKIIKHAELGLGFKLFRRARGRLHPTEEAEVLFAEVEKVFHGLESVRRVARNLRQDPATPLRIVCLPGLGISLVPRALSLYRRKRPRAAIEIATRHTGELAVALISREFDLGIGFGPQDGDRTVPGLDATLVTTGEMVYIDRAGRGRARADKPMRLADIDENRLIGLNSMHFLGVLLRAALEKEGLHPMPALQVQTYYIARALVAEGSGCAVVDEFTARAGGPEVTVQRIEPRVRFGVYAYSPELKPLSKGAAEFLDCFRTVCREAQSGG
ncbi:MAG: LysR family transcriptional regulator [Burkholderiales bacterium]|nr:LysR family transcriptional regulator [Burkholderiales bacterium]